MGEADVNGTPSNTAWKSYGRNVDGLVTTKDSPDVCTLQVGAPTSNKADGNSGIDNNWGQVFLPILQTAASLPQPSLLTSGAIQAGGPTLLVTTVGLTDDPAQTASLLSGRVYTTGPYGAVPAFDSTTDWPVDPASLTDPQDIGSGAVATFDQGYVDNGTFVTGPITGPVTLAFTLQGGPFRVVVHDAELWFDHPSPTEAVHGMLSGVLDTQEFVASLKQVAGSISMSLCGPAFDGVAEQILMAQDILLDGSNHSGVPCDAISIGVGFDATRVANPTKVAVIPTTPNPCP